VQKLKNTMAEIRPSLFRLEAERVFKKSLEVPSASCGAEIDASLLLDFLESRKDYEKYKFDACLIHIIGEALFNLPEMNLKWEGTGKESKIIKHESLNLGIAVRIPRNKETGAAVIRVREEIKDGEKDLWHMNLWELNRILRDISERVKIVKIFVKDFNPRPNIVFNNLGVFKNIDFGYPILPADVSIMVSAFRAKVKPVIFKGYIMPKPIMNLTVTFDHRLFDGPHIDNFLGILKEKIENPRF